MGNGLYRMRIALPFFVILLSCGCSSSQSAAHDRSITIDQWVAMYLEKNENLLCKRDVNGEYFFIAKVKNSDKIKAGIRVDVTGTKQPLTSLSGWRFQNEKSEYLTVATPPSVVKREYVRSNGQIYLEGVEYQILNLRGSSKLRAIIEIKKCTTSKCVRQKTMSNDEVEYNIDLCEIPMSANQGG